MKCFNSNTLMIGINLVTRAAVAVTKKRRRVL
jgi:hypothetical protein